MIPTSLCSEEYSDVANRSRFSRRLTPDWTRLLTRAWRAQVVAPLDFEEHREYEMAAQRTLGYDEDAQPCYCTYGVTIPELCSDDDEEFYAVVAYAEHLSAWRLRDGRWLIHRTLSHGERGAESPSSFYSFAETMPR